MLHVGIEKMPDKKAANMTGMATVSKKARQEMDVSSNDDSDGTASAAGPRSKDDGNRLSQRKEKKSAREKARRQRENALFDELANMCNVPSDMRDKSSVLKAVIKRVEEMRAKGGPSSKMPMLNSVLPTASPLGSPTGSDIATPSSVTSDITGNTGFNQDEMLFASRANWGLPTGGYNSVPQLYPSFPLTPNGFQPLSSPHFGLHSLNSPLHASSTPTGLTSIFSQGMFPVGLQKRQGVLQNNQDVMHGKSSNSSDVPGMRDHPSTELGMMDPPRIMDPPGTNSEEVAE